MEKEEEIKALVKQCEENIADFNADYFRSYDEGVLDALKWVLGLSEQPCVDVDY